jgi:hypothetical protein
MLPGGRKYTLALLALCMGFVLALFGKLTPEFTGIATVVVGAFALSNAAIDRAHAKNGAAGG